MMTRNLLRLVVRPASWGGPRSVVAVCRHWTRRSASLQPPQPINRVGSLVLLLFAFACVAAPAVRAGSALTEREWTVAGVVRQALVYVPPQATTNATPVVFVFHGHGGNMANAARSFGIHNLWPAALVIYPQGLNTPGSLVDPDGKQPGWQHAVGGQGDRDLKFFDALLATLHAEYRVDDKRIYATGHSNGGFFTYLLWAARGNRFAAVAPSAASAVQLLPDLKPKPVLHIAGQTDPLVKFAWQQLTVTGLRKINGCGEGEPWMTEQYCTLYPSKLGAPVVTCIHPGGHGFLATAPALIVKFFQEHALP